jgi:hypothetical protein
MGRLTLNVLLSFAQFEREVTAERIRDKLAASKRKGLWMGGRVPLGYDLKDRRLIVNAREAALVRRFYQRYLELGCVSKLSAELIGPPSWAVEDQTYAVPPSSSRYADGLFRTAWLNVMEPTHHRHVGRTRRVLRQTPNRRGKTLAVSCALVKTLTRRALAPYRIFSGTEQVPGARPKCCRMASSVLVENL